MIYNQSNVEESAIKIIKYIAPLILLTLIIFSGIYGVFATNAGIDDNTPSETNEINETVYTDDEGNLLITIMTIAIIIFVIFI
ncbi:MAG: hypothetical protein LBU40_04690 [Methanobrevibacter sp.]|jgi:hypothetical protein|nr:hypothetical protein [Methanobrevibacter sp.]